MEKETPEENKPVGIEKEAWEAWQEDQKTNPTAVNPHAFVYGYKVASRIKEAENKLLKEKHINLLKENAGLHKDNLNKSDLNRKLIMELNKYTL